MTKLPHNTPEAQMESEGERLSNAELVERAMDRLIEADGLLAVLAETPSDVEPLDILAYLEESRDDINEVISRLCSTESEGGEA